MDIRTIERNAARKNLDRRITWIPTIQIGRNRKGEAVMYQPEKELWAKRLDSDAEFDLPGQDLVRTIVERHFLVRYAKHEFVVPSEKYAELGLTGADIPNGGRVTRTIRPSDRISEPDIDVGYRVFRGRVEDVETLDRGRWLKVRARDYQ